MAERNQIPHEKKIEKQIAHIQIRTCNRICAGIIKVMHDKNVATSFPARFRKGPEAIGTSFEKTESAFAAAVAVWNDPFARIDAQGEQKHLGPGKKHQKSDRPGNSRDTEERRHDQQNADQRGDQTGHRKDELSEPFLHGDDAPQPGYKQPDTEHDHQDHVENQRPDQQTDADHTQQDEQKQQGRGPASASPGHEERGHGKQKQDSTDDHRKQCQDENGIVKSAHAEDEQDESAQKQDRPGGVKGKHFLRNGIESFPGPVFHRVSSVL